MSANSNGTTDLSGPVVYDAAGNAFTVYPSPLIHFNSATIIANSTELGKPATYQAPGLFSNAHENGQTWLDAHAAPGQLAAGYSAMNSAINSALSLQNSAVGAGMDPVSTITVQLLQLG